MMKSSERKLLLAVDFFTINLAWGVYYWFRVRSGWLARTIEPEFFAPMIAICAFWLIIFLLFGLYRSWYTKSRVDELITIFKAVTFGVFMLFFLIFIDDQGIGSPMHMRLLIAGYWGLLLVCVGGGRIIVHTVNRKLLEAKIGQRRTVIVGLGSGAWDLCEMVKQYPALGYRIVGFVATDKSAKHKSPYKEIPVVGRIENLSAVIEKHKIREVLVALDSAEHDKLLDIIAACNGQNVGMKIVPDLYDIVSGQARTNQIYGFPLIEIMPQILAPWEQATKRLFDIIVSASILFLGLPLWLLVIWAIKFDSPGPVFYVQERVGRDGKMFRMVKFRSMHHNAEAESGPVWAHKKDPRVTRAGRLLRRLRLDEIPQLLNVLRGDMSLVGPRPERPFFVEKLSRDLPLYARRLKVRPGITGWAQVKHKYDESLEDVKEKLKYDLFYIENMSLRMDVKILLNTIYVALSGKGH